MPRDDRSVRFDVDRFSINVSHEAAVEKATEIDGLDPEDDDDLDRAAKVIARSRFWNAVGSQTGEMDVTVARVLLER